jgi:hypothetical protein
MEKRMTVALAAVALLSGISIAAAAPSQATKTRPAADMLSLTKAQRQTAWKDLYSQAANQKTPQFKMRVGTIVPNTLKLAPVPSKVASTIPKLKHYDFSMAHNKLLIVNPADKKIVKVITG